MPWTDDYIGLPFKREGRDRSGVDCYGLVRLVYRERLGIELPGKQGFYTGSMKGNPAMCRAVSEALVDEAANRWLEVTAPREYDVILLRRGPLPLHVGVVSAPRHMLHVTSGIEATNEPYTGLRWRNRVVGFYRYAE